MRDEPSRTTEIPRALRRWSLARRVWCDTALPAELIQTLCVGDPDRVLFDSIPLQLKDRCVVGRYEHESSSLLIKRHAWGGLSRTLRMAFREPAARSCARLGLYLHDRGIPTPRPRATVDFRVGPWTHRSYLVSDYVEGTPLYRYIRFGSQTEVELRHVAQQVAQIWQRLVELGVSHNDFKPENFIVDENLGVWLIDMEKMRLSGKARRQQERQVFDVKNFLHVRAWHHRPEARAIFAAAFLQTPHGNWLRDTGVDRVAARSRLSETELDAELSVLILCENGINMPLVRQAIDSVHDIAEEVVLVEPNGDDRLTVLKRIEVCQPQITSKASIRNSSPQPWTAPIARCPWLLVLHQNECVTPFLAKELQQRIANAKASSAFRIPLEQQYFGRSIGQTTRDQAIRLFRQPECSYAFDSGELKVSADANQVSESTGTIQVNVCATVAEFVEQLNEQTSDSALRRFRAGQRPKLVRAAWRAARQSRAALRRCGGLRSGWAGLQIAVLEGAFAWIEEAKLYQLAAEFRSTNSREESSGLSAAGIADQCETSTTPSSKAA